MKIYVNTIIIILFITNGLCLNKSYAQLTLNFNSIDNTVCNGQGCDYSGPSILINEIMIAPNVGDGSIFSYGDTREGEWIELFNPDVCKWVDISCYYLGNAAPGLNGYTTDPCAAGGFILPPGSIVPARGFAIVRGRNAPAVPSNLLVANGGNTIEIVVENTGVCIGPDGNRLWFPNAGGWFAFYDENGIPQDAISWANNDCINSNPCNPNNVIGCNYNGSLSNYNSIPSERKNYITDSIPILNKTFSRIPDGGDWLFDIPTQPTYGTCNDTCVPLPDITCSGMAIVNVIGGTPPYNYIWDDPMIQTSDTAKRLCAGTYCVTVTDSNGNSATGCVTVNDYKINFAIPEDTSICKGDTIVLAANGEGDTYIWDNGVVDGQPFVPLQTHTYHVTGIISETECNNYDSVTINVVPYAFVNLGNDTCIENIPFILDATYLDDYTYHWSNGEQTPVIYVNQTGSYSVTVSYNNYSICNDYDTIEINYIPTPILDFPDSMRLCEHQDTIISVSQQDNSVYQFLWSTGNTTPIESFSHLDAGIYNISLEIRGCYIYTDSFILRIENCEIFIPNVITPNNDGINDFFQITNLEYYPNSQIKIYNRWGKKIYENEDYKGDWDGDNHSEGTYYYIFRLNYGHGKIEEYHGTITIMR